jgi:hypothetical protein
VTSDQPVGAGALLVRPLEGLLQALPGVEERLEPITVEVLALPVGPGGRPSGRLRELRASGLDLMQGLLQRHFYSSSSYTQSRLVSFWRSTACEIDASAPGALTPNA